MSKKTWLVASLVVVSVIVSSYEALFAWRNLEPRESVLSLGGFISVLILALWVDEDSKTHPEVYRPFDYGFLVIFYWVPYIPYYLWRTRRLRGLAVLGGFAVLLLLGMLARWVIYHAR